MTSSELLLLLKLSCQSYEADMLVNDWLLAIFFWHFLT